MDDTDSVFSDSVPIADALEQRLPAADSPTDDDDAPAATADVPLEADASDWRDQQETVLIDPELEEFDGNR